jgi:glutamate 5-kinase
MKREEIFKKFKRVVVKIGTQVLTSENNRLDMSVIEHIVEQVCFLVRERKSEVVMVTSGAIAAGMQVLGWKKRPDQISKLQGAASIGQSRLMRVYERLFKEEGINVGQILLTRDIFTIPGRRNNAKETITTLLRLNVIPVINENDSVAVDEIRFGDNDTLSALVTELLDMDILVMVTDVDGLSLNDPKKQRDSRVISTVKSFDRLNRTVSSGTSSRQGIGGMKSKISAAQYVTKKGKFCIILNGKKLWSIERAFKGEKIGTLFYPSR